MAILPISVSQCHSQGGSRTCVSLPSEQYYNITQQALLRNKLQHRKEEEDRQREREGERGGGRERERDVLHSGEGNCKRNHMSS